MNHDHGISAAIPHPAMRELLRQCVAQTQADVSLVALTYPARAGNHRALSIISVFPPVEQRTRLITRWVRNAVSQAVDAAQTTVIAGRVAYPSGSRSRIGQLIVAPMYTTHGVAWGAVAALRATPVADWKTVHSVEQCARVITDILAKSDNPDDQLEPHDSATSLFASSQATARLDFLMHELRVPLSAAIYALEALQQRHGADWAYDDEHLLYVAQSGVIEAQRIVHSASQWPAIGEGTAMPAFEPVSVNEALRRALTLLPSANSRILLKLDPDLPLILGNQSWMIHVLVNLLENALKYSTPSSAVTVSAYQSDEDFVLVSVRSSGKGLPLDDARRFSSGERKLSSGDATSKGLGLSIARYFVTSMGGEIWTEGDGSNVSSATVVLPVATAERPLVNGRA
ncbi:MAG TPA: HAMP domain-containing sensor histidine kinase [Ktedonobacterales bacterium]|nr:HAMP domain-containing sensor histidine kinase [Ktedonobacterales bacterium]